MSQLGTASTRRAKPARRRLTRGSDRLPRWSDRRFRREFHGNGRIFGRERAGAVIRCDEEFELNREELAGYNDADVLTQGACWLDLGSNWPSTWFRVRRL